MDKLVFGLGVSLVGMVIVFVGLAILILFIGFLKTINTGKKSVPAPLELEEPVPAFEADEQAISTQDASDASLLAVLTAAVCAMMGEGNQNSAGFVVRHVRRVHNAPAWQKAGREEQTYSRM